MSGIETVEIIEPKTEAVAEPAPAKPKRDELRAKGWSKEDMDSAEKHGLIEKAEPETKEPVEPKENAPEEDVKAEPKAEKKQEPTVPEKRPGIPDFSFKTPEQEKAWLDAFGPGTPQRGLYFRMKNERQARQAIEAERDALRNEIELLKRGKAPEKAVDDMDSLLSDGDVANNVEDKPLTIRDLKKFEEEKSRLAEEENRKEMIRRARIAEAHKAHEEYAREIYPDFDDAVVRATEVMKNLDDMVPEKWKREKVIRLMKDLQYAAANADTLEVDGLNASHIAYEISQYHPEHGKPKADKPERANGSPTSEVVKRMENNTQRRASSASVAANGGGRIVSIDDIGLKELNAMTSAERWKFREKHPDRYERLVRG